MSKFLTVSRFLTPRNYDVMTQGLSQGSNQGLGQGSSDLRANWE